MEKVKEFLKALSTNPDTRKLLGEEKEVSRENALAAYAKAARALGFDLTAEQIDAGIQALEAEQKSRTDKAEATVGELELDELEQASGGFFQFPEVCEGSYNDQENCWFTDKCRMVISEYTEMTNRWEVKLGKCRKTVKSTSWKCFDGMVGWDGDTTSKY